MCESATLSSSIRSELLSGLADGMQWAALLWHHQCQHCSLPGSMSDAGLVVAVAVTG